MMIVVPITSLSLPYSVSNVAVTMTVIVIRIVMNAMRMMPRP